MFNTKKLVSLVMSVVVGCTMVTAIPANAKCYENKGSGFKAVNNFTAYNREFSISQGIAGDSSYIYVAKIDSTKKYAAIRRVNPNNKNEGIITMTFTNSNVAGDLKHANDMFVLKENGNRYLYVNNGEGDIIKLQINDVKKTLKKVKRIKVYKSANDKSDSNKLKFSGLAGFEDELYNKSKYKIILKAGRQIFTATINKNNTNENVTAQKKFNLNTDVKMPTKKGSGKEETYSLSSSSYASQGITYYNGNLYVTYSMSSDNSVQNKSFIVIYKNLYSKLNSSGTSSNANPSDDAKFYYESDNFKLRYEIEGCTIVNNTLYFYVDRKSKDSNNKDAIFYMSGYRP